MVEQKSQRKPLGVNLEKNEVCLVTGVAVAIDKEEGLLIAGLVSGFPFGDDEQESAIPESLVGVFAFTRRQAAFLRERLNEFLEEEQA